MTIILLFASITFEGQFIAHADNATSTTETATSTPPASSTSTDLTPSSTVTSTISFITPSSTATSSTSSSTSDATPVQTPAAGASSDTASIVTGNAAAVANVINVVNANITDSSGLVEFLNLLAPYIGNIDLSGFTFPTSSCASCSGGALQVTNDNSASVTNNVDVLAMSGGNTITGAGTSTITTGDAVAAANVLNVVNTNLTNSQYLLLVLNNFTQMQGDLVLPGKSFFENFFSNNGGDTAGNISVANANSASIGNNATTVAATGDNTVAGASSSTISTGEAATVTNTVNEVNQNSTGGTRVYLLINVPGTWAGNVFSAPPGLKWEQTPDGLLLTESSAPQGFDGCADCGNSDAPSTIANANSANVQNNIQVFALTGSNEIDANGGSGGISTGNAVAATNVVNLVNTNIVGQNVLFAIINVLGNWQGNLAFGQPDLWTGLQAKLDNNPLVEGNLIHYTVTVKNNGTADATNVVVRTADSDPYVTVTDAGGGTMDGDSVSWTIPTLATGASQTFTYAEKVNAGLPYVGSGSMTESVSATETEDDANPKDNSDQANLNIDAPIGSLHLSKVFVSEADNATSTVAPGASVHYDITFGDRMWAGPAQNVFAHETLFDPYGNPVSTSTWDIGNIGPGNKFRISYNANFAPDTPTGWYISEVTLDGKDVGGYIGLADSIVATSSVYVVDPTHPFTAPP